MRRQRTLAGCGRTGRLGRRVERRRNRSALGEREVDGRQGQRFVLASDHGGYDGDVAWVEEESTESGSRNSNCGRRAMLQWLEISRKSRKQVEAQEALVSEGLDKVADRRAGITALRDTRRGVDAACGERCRRLSGSPTTACGEPIQQYSPATDKFCAGKSRAAQSITASCIPFARMLPEAALTDSRRDRTNCIGRYLLASLVAFRLRTHRRLETFACYVYGIAHMFRCCKALPITRRVAPYSYQPPLHVNRVCPGYARHHSEISRLSPRNHLVLRCCISSSSAISSSN